MRGHGELNFYFVNRNSVPSSTANGPVISIMGEVVPGVDPQTPQFGTAMKACKHLLPGGPPAPVTQKQKDQMLKFAACMRTHGYPSYPDPQFPAGGGVMEQQPTGIDTSSRQFQAATKTCNAES